MKIITMLVLMFASLVGFAANPPFPRLNRPTYRRPASPLNNRGNLREGARNEAFHHWDGRRLEHSYFVGRFGFGHPFLLAPEMWFGTPYLIGSEFYFGGCGWGLLVPFPEVWIGNPGLYIDELPDGGYVVVNPLYPGVTLGVRVVI